jgi:hypothetical protein
MYRWAVGVALVTAFLLTWMSLGVGVIGADGDPANLLYGGVLAVGLVGAVVARFQPSGMVRTLVATALAQVLVAAIAVVARLGSTEPSWPLNILLLTGFFVGLWLVSARLFRRAARQRQPTGAESKA